MPRVFGLALMPDLTWVTRSVAHDGALGGRCAGRARRSLYALSRPLGTKSSAARPRRLATSSGRCSDLQPGDRGPGDVDVVGRAERLAQHVVHAGLLEDDAGRATGDDAGTGGGRLHQHAAGAGDADHRVGDRVAGEGDVEQVALGLFGALLDGEGHLLGLAVAEADTTVAVADHDERGEREPATTLDDLGDAVDRDDPRLPQPAFGSSRRAATALVASCCCRPSELQTCFSGGGGEGRDPPVVDEPAAVEHDRVDAGGLGPLGDELADAAGGVDGAAVAGGRAGRPRPSRRRRACARRRRR